MYSPQKQIASQETKAAAQTVEQPEAKTAKAATPIATNNDDYLMPEPPKPAEGSAALSAQYASYQSDAPACDSCGAITVRSGNCYLCYNCGKSMGCS